MQVQALVFTKSAGKVYTQIQGAEDYNIGNVGQVSGSTAFHITEDKNDEGGYQPTLNFSQHDENGSMELVGFDITNNLNFHGHNITADFSKAEGDQTITLDAKNSKVHAGNGSNVVKTTAQSENNTIISGYNASDFSDSGSNNTFKALGGANYFQTTGSSKGANIYDGAGASTFDIAGQYGFVDGGNGDDTFNLHGEMLVNKNFAYRNVITGGNGNDVFTGKGAHNLIFGNEGRDNYSVGGDWNLANLGFYEGADVRLPSSSRFGMAFTTTNFTSANGVTYDYYTALNGEYYASNSNYFDLFFAGRDSEESNATVQDILKHYNLKLK